MMTNCYVLISDYRYLTVMTAVVNWFHLKSTNIVMCKRLLI